MPDNERGTTNPPSTLIFNCLQFTENTVNCNLNIPWWDDIRWMQPNCISQTTSTNRLCGSILIPAVWEGAAVPAMDGESNQSNPTLPRWGYLCSLQKCCCRVEGHRSPRARPRPAPLHSAAEQKHTPGLGGFSVLWQHPCSFHSTQQTLLQHHGMQSSCSASLWSIPTWNDRSSSSVLMLIWNPLLTHLDSSTAQHTALQYLSISWHLLSSHCLGAAVASVSVTETQWDTQQRLHCCLWFC